VIKIIPYDIAWGGWLGSDSEMLVFEGISIGMNLFIGLVLLMKGKYISFRFRERTLNAILWVLLSLFLLNTVGNIFARTPFEKVFAIVTLFFAFLIWKILKAKDPGYANKKSSRHTPMK
jgi:hypothetical protein